MHSYSRRSARAAALALVFAGACGELADQDTKAPTLASIRGTLHVQSGASAPQGNIRLALLWQLPREADSQSEACWEMELPDNASSLEMQARDFERLLIDVVQEDVEITPQFPSAFQLDLRQLPPSEALGEDQGAKVATAVLVAYVDGNDNGRLDPRAEHTSSPDLLLHIGGRDTLTDEDTHTNARAWYYLVHYAEQAFTSTFTGADGVKVHEETPAGFRVVGYKVWPKSDGIDLGHGLYSAYKTVDEVEIDLKPAPSHDAKLCTQQCRITTFGSVTCPASPADLPVAPVGAVVGYSQNSQVWSWREGTDTRLRQERACVWDRKRDEYSLFWNRAGVTGCSEGQLDDCHYGPVKAPPADWPCDTYVDLSYGQDYL